MTKIVEKEIEMWPIDKITPYEKNAKIHDPAQVTKIAQSIKKFGWSKSKSIEVDVNGEIINGHGRRLAAIELGLSAVPVTVRDDLSEMEIKQYRIADNKVAESSWDTRLLADEYLELKDMGAVWDDLIDERDIDFAIEDNGEIDYGALTDDLMGDMDSHQDETQARIKDTDQGEVAIGKVFSFSKVTGEQARNLTLLEKYAEGETKLKGAAALSSWIESLLTGN